MDIGHVIELVALLGAGVGALGAVTWALVTYINNCTIRLSDRINEQDEKRSQSNKELHAKIEQASSTLDEKFNSVNYKIDQVKDNYVRRDDLDRHLARMEMSQRDLVEAVNRLRGRLDEVVVKLVDFLAHQGATIRTPLDKD